MGSRAILLPEQASAVPCLAFTDAELWLEMPLERIAAGQPLWAISGRRIDCLTTGLHGTVQRVPLRYKAGLHLIRIYRGQPEGSWECLLRVCLFSRLRGQPAEDAIPWPMEAPLTALKGEPELQSVSVVIPTFYQPELLYRLVERLAQPGTPIREIHILENNPQPHAQAFLSPLRLQADFLKVHRQPGPFNFSRLCNEGAQLSCGAHLLFLNDDIAVEQLDWLSAMAAWSNHPKVGAVGLPLYYPDGTVQHAGIELRKREVARNLRPASIEVNAAGYTHVPAVTGACLMVERSRFLSVGGFSESLAVRYNDVDLCLKLKRAGFTTLLLAGHGLMHHESKSRRVGEGALPQRIQAAMEKRWMLETWPEFYHLV